MNNSRFRNSSESLSVKKELEMLVKMSKMEYQDSSKKEFLKSGETSSGKTSKKLHSKATEILEVVGDKRRSSSRKPMSPNAGKKSQKEAKGLVDIKIPSCQESLDTLQEMESMGLNVVMKGEGMMKKQEMIKDQDFVAQDVKNVDDLLCQLFHSEEQLPSLGNPAILAATNTTKSVALQPRKKPTRYNLPTKPKHSKNRRGKLSERQSHGVDNAPTQKKSLEDTLSSSSAENTVKNNLTSFDELDKEFYDIMKSKLKIDLKEKDLKEVDAEENKNDSVNDLARRENVEELVAEEGVNRGIAYRAEDILVTTNVIEKPKIRSTEHLQVEDNGIDRSTEKDSPEKSQQKHGLVAQDDKNIKDNTSEQLGLMEKNSAQDEGAYEERQLKYEIHIEDNINSATDLQFSVDYSRSSAMGIHQYKADDITNNQEKGSDDLESIKYDDAIKILQTKTELSYEDIVHVSGEKAFTELRPTIIPVNNAAFVSKDALHKVASKKKNSFLASWTQPTRKQQPSRGAGKLSNIHHFCTSIPAIQLPSHLKTLSKFRHTPDKNTVLKNKLKSQQADSPGKEDTETTEDPEPRVLTLLAEKNKPTEEEVRLTELASKILEDAMKQEESKADEGKVEKTFLKLQNVINQVFCENDEDVLCLQGKKADIKQDETRLYWTPAPPKFDLPPELVKQQLIPRYHGARLDNDEEADGINSDVISDEDSSSDDDVNVDVLHNFRQRSINRGHGSASTAAARKRKGLQNQIIKEEEEIIDDDSLSNSSVDHDSMRASPSAQSITEMRRAMAKMREDVSKKKDEENIEEKSSDFSIETPKRRAYSQPLVSTVDEKFQKFDSGYDVSFQELQTQIEDVTEMKEEIMKRELANKESEATLLPPTLIEDVEVTEKTDGSVSITAESYITHTTTTGNRGGMMSSVGYYPPSRRNTKSSINSKLAVPSKLTRKHHSKKMAKKKQRDPERERQIKEFLEQPPRIISRSLSFQDLDQATEKERNSLKRYPSLQNGLCFEEKIGCRYVGTKDDLFQWTKEEYWYQWFDELYPPSVKSVEDERPQSIESEVQSNLSDEILQKIEVINPSSDTEFASEIYQLLKKEIDVMTVELEGTKSKETLAFHHCRRGACYRKIGELKNAWEDLERAISLEPKLLDAYWHRHLLYLLQDNSKKALVDLDHILKHNTSHIGAYRSRAEIYKKKGDWTSAIFNYSQAIKLDPTNSDVYYDRAYMFKERGDILLALEDFKEAHNLLPSRTEGIRNIGMYHFENRSWTAAINDFTALVTHEPYNAEAYTYRARAYAKLAKYENALKDLSLAIHLDPNNAIGFFYRGCLLRKCSQRQSLQDLSTSILLDDTVRNIDAYLHRGILYNEMKRWEEAMVDFEAALGLDSHIPAAHVNLGLIQMTRMSNPTMAIRRFNTAIKVDPTYVRAYICRAEASQKTKNIRAAIDDYTRAIHIRPDVTDYRMARGKLLMEEGMFDLASYHIKQCAKMSAGAGSTPAQQQAVVHTFLKNHSQAIEILEKAVKSKPLPHLFILLGKTKAKAKMHKEAIESFERALQLMKPWDSKVEWPVQAADVYFLIGMVYTEIVNHSMALEAFNNTLKINPEFSQAYYQRGLTKMKLQHAKAIQDFNKALAYNPKLFQAFLSRAAYYGMKGRYAKAIMNCNEVIRLQPKSIRGYLYRGALKYHIKAYQLAVKDLTEAIAIDPSCKVAYFNRAVCYQEMRFFQKALEDYGIVLLLEKKPDMKVLQNRGLLYLEIGDIDNALQDFSTASKLEPKNPRLHHTLGICYQRLGKLDDAIDCFANALHTDAFFVDALLGRGNAMMDYGTVEGNSHARRDYERALHLDPLCLLARVNLAYSLQVQGRYKAAWMQFTKCIELDEGFKSAYEGRSVINLQMGNSFGAFVDINQALKIEETAEFLTNRGVINQFMDDNVNAMRDYQAALKRDPTYSLAYYNAANLYFNQRQFPQAVDYYDRALGWNKNDESAFVNRAITRVMLKNVEGALQDFDQAMELSPYSAHIYFNRGNLRASLGCYEDAEKDYTTALHLQPGDAIVYKRRADVRGKMSKKKEALKDYKLAILIQTKKIKAR